MTIEQLNAITYRLISHASYEDEHISVYESTNFAPTITVKVFTKIKNMFETGKPRRMYYFMGKAYRSKERLCKAIDEYQKINKMRTENKGFLVNYNFKTIKFPKK